ncbi:right-handed parallel beta-helix repeat-containing protein [Flavobacteriales bacterium]|nr:right-handed parallel beta-helix repeat-containing protein [Flavobacteriales bacterium]
MLKIGGSSLLMLLLPLAGAAQLSFTVDTVGFPPTTVDSTRTLTLTLTNELVVEQSVAFSGVSGPFSLGAESLTIPGESSADLEVVFSPVSVNTFTMNLTATGSAFGSDVVHVTGEGTLPQAALLADTLDFGSVSVNSYATEYLPMASVGIGSLYVDSIVSSNPVISAAQGVAIAQGDTAQIPVTFYSEFSGIYEVDLTIYTSDPFESVRYAHCTISAISEVGGEVCGTWSLVNSPYLLVDDVVVPNGCSLTIEPGVIILGDSLDIEVFGALYANGTAELPIDMTVGELLSHTAAENMVLTHSTVTETNEFEFLDTDYRDFRDLNIYPQDSLPFWFDFVDAYELMFENENPQFGKYVENFSDNNGQGWSHDGSVDSQNESGEYEVYYDGSSSSYYTTNIYTPSLALNSGESPDVVSFRARQDWWSTGYNRQMRYFVRYDGGGWNELQTINSPGDGQWYNLSYELSAPENVQSVQFKFEYYYRYYSTCQIDDFVLTTNFYIGEDVPLPPAAAAAASLSTGGIQLAGSTYNGDFHSVGDSIDVVLENSAILGNETRDKDSHGLGLYADHVNLTTTNSTVSGHGLDGVHIESMTTDWISSQTTLEGNGEDGMEVNGDLVWHSESDKVESNLARGLAVSGNAEWLSTTSTIADNGNEGFTIGGNAFWNSFQDVVTQNGLQGFTASGALTLEADSTFVTGNGSHGIEAMGSNSDVTLYQCQLKENGGDGIQLTGSLSDLEADYSFVRDNGGDAVEMGSSGTLRMDNCLLGYNGGYGINSSGAVDLNYMNILHNGGYGIRTSQFSTVDNSIVWFNGGVPQMITGNTFAVSYTNVQGINALLTSTDFAWGDGCIGTDPVLADDQGHLDPYSPCVDGGMPWEQDAHIPYGLGSSRADMGMYGGPANDYWGGQAPPDGAVQITDVFDIPQDQGGFVGMHFTASPFDFGGLGFNVTHYSIWRDLALGSDTPADVSAGNWEQIGEVPAQGFSQYGYTAATLVDAYPDEPACLTSFIVIAHTTDDNIYWVSDVAAACSEDNLAPAIPELGGMVLADETDEAIALLSWTLPEEEDYAYTVVTGDNGFSGTITDGDTLVTDPSIEPGLIVTYEAVHFDVHGNASESAALALEAPQEKDQIPLNPGWNLISTDRSEIPELSEVFSGLMPGNLEYVTGFNNGIEFYDPNGFPFLNTLTSLTPGMGYWVKVVEADVLEVSGSRLDEGYMPGLVEGWNLIGYAPEAPEAPGVVFADLVASGDLLYVTGFDLGVQVYDPLGLPFLNSLGAMRNGFGYWVKSAAVTEAGVFAPLAEDALLAEQPSPLYDVVNGVSKLGAHAGEIVDVVNDWGMTVARLPILEGGHLMTTALFGDDPATSVIEGLSVGETLHFAFRGAMANETLVFGGDMSHKTLSLTFEEIEASTSVFPNPASDAATLRFQMDKDAQVEVTLMDLAGRQVAVLLQADKCAGAHEETLDLPEVEAGAYTVQMRVAGEVTGKQRLVITQ